MKKTHIYCDICGNEIWDPTADGPGYRAKRVSTELVNKEARAVQLELCVYVQGWSGGLDICYQCGDKALQKAKRKLAFEIVGEK